MRLTDPLETGREPGDCRRASPDSTLVLSAALLRGGLAELRRLRVIRGRHTRTRRRIAAARGLVAAAAVLLCAPFAIEEARAFGDPEFVSPFLIPNNGSIRAQPALADIDDDGDLDALVGNFDGDMIFFENTGSAAAPAFASASTNPFGLEDVGSSASPEFADIDGDGDLDALVGNVVGNTIFFENTGSAAAPAFASASTNPFGLEDVGTYASPELADIDGDGDLDAFVGNFDGDMIFFENTGSASAPAFAPPATNPFGLADVGSLVKPDFADIDGDGDLDAFVGGSNGNTIFFENTGSAAAPEFALPETNPLGLADVGNNANPELADIDGDGDLDALVGRDGGNTIFFENTGTTTGPAFMPPSTDPFGLAFVGGEVNPDFADADGDGDLDAFVGTNDGETFFFENTGSTTAPAFAPPSSDPFGLTDVGDVASPELADVDGDGDLDAFVGNFDGDMIFFENTGVATAPAFAPPETNPFGLADVVGTRASPQLADVDGDGDLDVLRGSANEEVVLFENTGVATAPAFAAPVMGPYGLAGTDSRGELELADVDGDGDLDAFVGRLGDTFFFENTGVATAPAFAPPETNPFGLADVGSSASPELADIDGDGDLDAFVGTFLGEVFFFENTRAAQHQQFAPGVTNPFGLTAVPYGYTAGLASPTLADIDGDGDLDLLAGNGYGNFFLFENTGTMVSPAFAASAANPFGLADIGARSTPTLVDLDGDGDADVLTGAEDGNLIYFQNTGSAGSPMFAGAQVNPLGLRDVGSQSAPELVDLDGDGDLDLIVGEAGGGFELFENTGNVNAPVFDGFPLFGLGSVLGSSKPAAADIDGDGDFDVFSGESQGEIRVFPNGGTVATPAFGADVSAFEGADVGNSSDPTFADLDGDGDLDALVGNAAGNFVFFENQRLARFVVTTTAEAQDCSVAIGGEADGICAALSPSLACDGTGACTLRAAFQEIHEDPEVEAGRIEFDIPGTPPHVIGIGSWPLVIDVPMTLDGTANPPCGGAGVIEIEGDTLDLLIREDARICGMTLK